MNTAVIKLIVWKLVSTTETKWWKTIVKIQNFIAFRWNLSFWNLTQRLTNMNLRLRMGWFVIPFKWYTSQLMHYHFVKRALFFCSSIFGSFEKKTIPFISCFCHMSRNKCVQWSMQWLHKWRLWNGFIYCLILKGKRETKLSANIIAYSFWPRPSKFEQCLDFIFFKPKLDSHCIKAIYYGFVIWFLFSLITRIWQ